jgi:hypothetical protein
MKKNIILKLNDEVILFTKNIKWDISENKKYTYLIASNKPFFNFDKLLTFFIENELTNFTENQLNILLKNCNIFLSLNKEYNAIKTTKNGFTVHYIAEKKIKEYKGSFGGCKKLVRNTGKTLMDLNEDEFLRTYKAKNISIYCYNYFTLSLTIEKLIKLISDVLTKEPQQIEINNPDEVKKELHNNIFKGNAFEVLEKYFSNKNVNGSSATDLRLVFELMKIDNLFIETIELKHYINWLNKYYFENNLITLRNINLNTRPNIQRKNDYIEYKDATLK